MKRIHILLIIFLASTLTSLASPRDEQEACRIAQQWWANQGMEKASARFAQLATTATLQGKAWCVKRGSQFVLVGNDPALPTVLGYGTTQSEQMPAALSQLCLRTTSASRYPLDGTKWVPVAPLVQTQHSFTSPYNDLAPYYTNDEGTTSPNRCVPGCVAIAMEQVLTYYRRTYTLQDTLYGWTTPHYVIPDLLPGEQFDTRLIRNSYDDTEEGSAEERHEVARLMYALGVAAHMNWGTGESGANSVTLVEPLKRAFGLKYVHYLDSYKYDPVAYWNFLAREIACGRPVYYAGGSMTTEGHAFVIDGLDADGLFHVNWGYEGAWDGYFRLDVLSLREPLSDRKEWVDNGFFCNQEAIAICPDDVTDNCPPDSLHRTGREVAIEKIMLLDKPTTTCPTRVRLVVHNVTDTMLTTPFALIESLDSDTALWEQADWLAFTGTTLQPHQRDTLTVHVTFVREGKGWLRITPDGEQVIDSLGIDVGQEGTALVEADEPVIDFANAQTVVISQKLRNPSVTTRGANHFFFDLNDQGFHLQLRKSHRVYLSANADTMITQQFTDLTPGKVYTYKLRRGGKTIVERTFTMPTAEGITPIYIGNEAPSARYYSINGRYLGEILPNTYRGVVIKREGAMTKKMILK